MVSHIPTGDGKTANLFLQCKMKKKSVETVAILQVLVGEGLTNPEPNTTLKEISKYIVRRKNSTVNTLCLREGLKSRPCLITAMHIYRKFNATRLWWTFFPAGANNQKSGSSFSQLNEVHLNLAHCYMGCTVNFSSQKM